MLSESRSPIPAIAFANEVLARLQPAILHQPVIDDAGQIRDVLVRAVEEPLCFVWRNEGVAEPRPDRIDEHEISEIEPCPRIVAQGCRIRRALPRTEGDAFRTDRTQIQIDRRGSRASVESES